MALKEIMLDKLKRAMKRERFRYGKTYFNANVRYLARRYARFILVVNVLIVGHALVIVE